MFSFCFLNVFLASPQIGRQYWGMESAIITIPIKKKSTLYNEQMTFRVSLEVKEMERELRNLNWDTAEVARLAVKQAFAESLALEEKTAANDKK